MGFPAEAYEKSMVPGLFAPWASSLVQSANAQSGERALDVACGTGIIARHLAPRLGAHGMVIGLDLNPGMIHAGRAAAGREGLDIKWSVGSAEELPFAESNFDLVVCQFGLMFFTDRHKALMEIHRVVRAGGRVVLSVWQGLDRHPFYQTLHEVSRRHLGKSSVQAVFSLGDSDELRGLLIEAGFQHVEIEPALVTARFSNPEAFLAWEIDVDPAETPALQGLDYPAQQEILAAVRRDMQAALRAVLKDGQVVLETHGHIAHARR